MSTDLTDNRLESTDAVVTTQGGDNAAPAVAAQYDNPTAPGYVPPPDGMRYMKNPVDKKVLIGQDGKPVVMPKKKSKGRKKGKKPTFLVPDGGFGSVEPATQGFDVNKHAKLKPSDFPDPLHWAQWEQWYFEQRVAQCKADVERLLELGSTVEERKAAQEENRAMKAIEELLAKKGGKSSKMLERLGKLFAEASSK